MPLIFKAEKIIGIRNIRNNRNLVLNNTALFLSLINVVNRYAEQKATIY